MVRSAAQLKLEEVCSSGLHIENELFSGLYLLSLDIAYDSIYFVEDEISSKSGILSNFGVKQVFLSDMEYANISRILL